MKGVGWTVPLTCLFWLFWFPALPTLGNEMRAFAVTADMLETAGFSEVTISIVAIALPADSMLTTDTYIAKHWVQVARSGRTFLVRDKSDIWTSTTCPSKTDDNGLLFPFAVGISHNPLLWSSLPTFLVGLAYQCPVVPHWSSGHSYSLPHTLCWLQALLRALLGSAAHCSPNSQLLLLFGHLLWSHNQLCSDSCHQSETS